jgi:hydrogenase maturation protease
MTNGHNYKTLVLGLGNPILSDDGIGCHVALALKKKIKKPEIDVIEASIAGLDVLEILADYDTAIIIDAIQTKEGSPGQIYRFEPDMFVDTCHTSTPHSVNFATAIKLGEQLGLPLPQRITIFAIEVNDVISFSEMCTPEVTAAIPACVSMVVQEIREHHNQAIKLSG